jgi:peptidoglycan L-alanyl-D-glutamate endopeptidase CwlK
MPNFSQRSKQNLSNVHEHLKLLLDTAIQYVNFTVIDGRRSKEFQNAYYRDGKSNLQYPQSKHNAEPSLAVDIAPYPIDFSEQKRFYYQVGFILGLANRMNIPVRAGLDWDQDHRLVPWDEEESFLDLPHLELDVPYHEGSKYWPEDDDG